MNVCHIVSTFPRALDDPEVPWLLQCIRRLKEKGLEVKVFAPAFKGLRDQEISGISVHRFRYFFRRWENLTHDEGAPNKLRKNPLYIFVAIFYILFGVIDIIRYCHRERFDILHVHWPFPHGIFGMIGGQICGARVILNFHGAELLLVQKHPLIRPCIRFFLHHADSVIANSSFTRERIVEIERQPVEVIPFGAAVEEKRYTKSKDPVKTILFVGRLIERKGVEYLIRAMPHVLAKVNAKLIIVGEGHQRPVLEKLIVQKRLNRAVKLTGKVSDEVLREWYAGCDVFVLPSIVDARGDTEGLGIVLLEALSYKKPVVASKVGGIPDITIHGETGLLVPQKDSHALAESILRVLMDETFARRLGARGYKYVKERFSWERITYQIIHLYRDVIEYQI